MLVQILLSTYNGAAYLGPLLGSLQRQDYPHVEILARDDGSSDGTGRLLREYAGAMRNLTVIEGTNLGFAQSFMMLLRLSSPSASFIALCDQDDVWHSDKITRAVDGLRPCPREIPVMYCSRLAIVDRDLKPLGHSQRPKRGLTFRNALVECPIQGCTMLLNQAARRILVQAAPRFLCSHDWWIYLTVSAFGQTFYDERPSLLYRQHGGNVFGVAFGLGRMSLKVRRFLANGGQQMVLRQAEEFHRLYGDCLPSPRRRELEPFLASSRSGLRQRLGYALSCDVYRQSALNNLILKGLISVNRL
jgi:glycosyltransferase involved in cell wall biosynthesis